MGLEVDFTPALPRLRAEPAYPALAKLPSGAIALMKGPRTGVILCDPSKIYEPGYVHNGLAGWTPFEGSVTLTQDRA